MHLIRQGALSASVLILSAMVVSLVLTATASAQAVAPAITPARITVDTPVAPGAEVDLPSLVVRNHGTDALVTTMGVAPEGDEDTRGWIHFDPATFELGASEARVVEVTLKVPADVPLGPRIVRLRASVRQDTETTGVAIGLTAAVAALLVFDVGWPPEGSEATANSEGPRGVGGIPLRLWLVVPVAIAAGAASWTLMTFLGRYELSVRRKPPSD